MKASLFDHMATLVAVVCLWAATPAHGQSVSPGTKPNILVIFPDNVGWQNVSAYGLGTMGYRTPNIDRIAREGVMFTAHYAQRSCTAGRAAMITGQYPIRSGMTTVGRPGAALGLQPESPTLAEVLKPLGYATGQFGKNHLGDRNEHLPTVHGFDELFGNLYHLNTQEEFEQVDYPKDPEYFRKYGTRGVLHSWATDVNNVTDAETTYFLGSTLTWNQTSPIAATPSGTFQPALMAPLTLSLKMASFTLQPGVDEPTTVDPTAGALEPADTDKSGTDPTKFLRTLKLVNEFQGLTTNNYLNITSLQYIQPFADAKMNLRVKVPLAWTDAQGGGETGLGDIQLRYNWLSYADTKQAVLLGAELTADSASEDVLGRGKWIISPLVTYAMFLNKNVIFAPTYQHNLSFAGDSDRGDVNESVLDFYLVMTADNKKSWVTIDPTLGIDWENDERMPFSVEVELGRNIGTLLGGALNAYMRPGIGIGQDRPYDWNIEIGFTIIGF